MDPRAFTAPNPAGVGQAEYRVYPDGRIEMNAGPNGWTPIAADQVSDAVRAAAGLGPRTGVRPATAVGGEPSAPAPARPAAPAAAQGPPAPVGNQMYAGALAIANAYVQGIPIQRGNIRDVPTDAEFDRAMDIIVAENKKTTGENNLMNLGGGKVAIYNSKTNTFETKDLNPADPTKAKAELDLLYAQIQQSLTATANSESPAARNAAAVALQTLQGAQAMDREQVGNAAQAAIASGNNATTLAVAAGNNATTLTVATNNNATQVATQGTFQQQSAARSQQIREAAQAEADKEIAIWQAKGGQSPAEVAELNARLQEIAANAQRQWEAEQKNLEREYDQPFRQQQTDNQTAALEIQRQQARDTARNQQDNIALQREGMGRQDAREAATLRQRNAESQAGALKSQADSAGNLAMEAIKLGVKPGALARMMTDPLMEARAVLADLANGGHVDPKYLPSSMANQNAPSPATTMPEAPAPTAAPDAAPAPSVSASLPDPAQQMDEVFAAPAPRPSGPRMRATPLDLPEAPMPTGMSNDDPSLYPVRGNPLAYGRRR